MKRFYKLVSLDCVDNGFAILLDGKQVRTATKKILLAPDQAIANLVMQEWAAQEGAILPDTMPVTQFLTTMQDLTADKRDEVREEVLNYIDTDLICYRADSEPYATRQQEVWGPAIKWAEDKWSLKIHTTSSLQPLKQDAQTHQAFRSLIKNLDNFQLTVFRIILEDTGSFILTAAFLCHAMTAEDLWRAVFVDDMIGAELYREDLYGAAPDQEKKREQLRRNFNAAEQVLKF